MRYCERWGVQQTRCLRFGSAVQVLVVLGRQLVLSQFMIGDIGWIQGLRYISVLALERSHPLSSRIEECTEAYMYAGLHQMTPKPPQDKEAQRCGAAAVGSVLVNAAGFRNVFRTATKRPRSC